jgi:D-serine deaminase-like pyridoxal phosphate-dependent protein
VVSHAGGNVVLDSGSKVLGADRPSWTTGSGRLLDHPAARLTLLSEHHAVASWADAPLPSLGSRLRVVPNHVCNAVNLADELVVVRNGASVDVWPVAARGANT